MRSVEMCQSVPAGLSGDPLELQTGASGGLWCASSRDGRERETTAR